ncbi:putative adhesin SprC [Flavobacterium daejeonense]|nr:putative adhesin SprC [Flavobacterium daejeonense]
MSKKLHNYFLCLVFFLSPLTKEIYAQLVIGNPSLGFTQICTDATYNAQKPFEVTFTFTPETALSPSNQFIVELSAANGFFGTTPTVLATSNPEEITTSPGKISFSIPTNTAGENYKIRVKSTAPGNTSANSASFAAYYKIQDSPFTINNFVSTATYCPGASYILNIDNPGTGTNDSPLKYPSLTFNWFKEPGTTPIATGNSLTVTQPGVYYAETNYGSCTSYSYSNRVTVSESSSGNTTTISSSQGNPFCSNDGTTILSTVSGNSYQWYKDSKAISGATNQTYTATQAGQYSVAVNFGGCTATAVINLQSYQFSSSIDVSETNFINADETLPVTVTTNALNPEYKWFLNETLIPDATAASYQATEPGNYKVEITQTSGCVLAQELTFRIISSIDPNAEKIPNLVSPNNDGFNDTWIIPQEYTSGTDTEIVLMNATGEIVLKTNNYQNNWPETSTNFKNVNPVYYYIITTKDQKTKKGSITLVK